MVKLIFDSGFPTGLRNANRLAALIKRDGPPTAIEGNRLIWTLIRGGRYSATWDYYLSNSQLQFRGQRRLIGVQ